ncbi:MAG: tetratricopeptide repeat protein [Flammeovirgaceae bacterium]|nr:tetratricopeptide repeat protein [Flammeovirgaceae bacterium]
MNSFSKSFYFSVKLLTLFFSIGSFIFPIQAQEFEKKTEEAYYPLLEISNQKQVESLTKNAEKFMDNGAYITALPLINMALEKKPNDKNLYYMRASCFEGLEDYVSAVNDYNIVLKNAFFGWNGYTKEALFGRAISHFKLENYPLAIEDFDMLLHIPDKETNAVYFKSGDFGGGSSGSFNSIMTLSTQQDAEIFNYLGQAKMNINYRDGAIEDFTKALEIDPENSNLYVNRGIAYQKFNNENLAIQDFYKALEIDPENSLALFNMALIGKNNANAINLLDNAIDGETAFPSAYINRGYVKYENGDYAGALDDFNRAISLDKVNVEAYFNRALAYQKLKKYQKAIADFTKALQLDPSWAKVYASRGETYYKLKDFNKALTDYSMAIGYDPGNATYYYNRGLTYHSLKNQNQSCEDLKKSLSLGFSQAKKPLAALCNQQ